MLRVVCASPYCVPLAAQRVRRSPELRLCCRALSPTSKRRRDPRQLACRPTPWYPRRQVWTSSNAGGAGPSLVSVGPGVFCTSADAPAVGLRAAVASCPARAVEVVHLVVVPPLRYSGVATAAVVAVVPPPTTVLVVAPLERHSTWPQGPSWLPAQEAASWAACLADGGSSE